MKVLAGDWPSNSNATLKTGFTGAFKGVTFQTGVFSFETIPLESIVSADVVTADNHMSVARKLGWGVAGGVVLGPIGAIVGAVAGGNQRQQVVAVQFTDGRRVVLHGNTKQLMPVLAAGVIGRARPQEVTAAATIESTPRAVEVIEPGRLESSRPPAMTDLQPAEGKTSDAVQPSTPKKKNGILITVGALLLTVLSKGLYKWEPWTSWGVLVLLAGVAFWLSRNTSGARRVILLIILGICMLLALPSVFVPSSGIYS